MVKTQETTCVQSWSKRTPVLELVPPKKHEGCYLPLIKRNLFPWDLRKMLKRSRAQTVVSSVLPLGDTDPRERRLTDQVNDWLHSQCNAQGFGFCDFRCTFETRHVDTRWDTPDQMGQQCSGQQTGWAYQQTFKSDSAGEGGVPLGDEEESRNTSTLGSTREIPVTCPRGTREGSSRKVIQAIAQLKCFYTNYCSMGNKQVVLETMVQLENL